MALGFGRWHLGGGTKYPIELAAKLLRSGRKADPEDVKQLINDTKKIYDDYQSLRSRFDTVTKELAVAEHTIRLLQVSDDNPL